MSIRLHKSVTQTILVQHINFARKSSLSTWTQEKVKFNVSELRYDLVALTVTFIGSFYHIKVALILYLQLKCKIVFI